MAVRNKMIPEEVAITPKLAAHWLQFNTGNRKLPVGNVKYYSELIEKGEFLTTHQALAFTGDLENPGRLLDGQTRLSAIIATGKTIKQWVFWNAPEITFSAIDGGKPRSFIDHHPDYSKNSISVVNVLWWLSSPSLRKITKTDADLIWGGFGSQFEKLMNTCPTSRKGISCAAVKAAFCLCMRENPKESDEIAEIYRNLVLEKIEHLPISVNRLFIKLLTVVGGGIDAVRVQFPFTHKAVSPDKWGLTKLYGPEPGYFKDLAIKIRSYAGIKG